MLTRNCNSYFIRNIKNGRFSITLKYFAKVRTIRTGFECWKYLSIVSFITDETLPLLFVGTVFLWVYWPSFNGGGVTGDQQHRAVLNTYLSLATCTLVTFIVSALVDKKGKFDMVSI